MGADWLVTLGWGPLQAVAVMSASGWKGVMGSSLGLSLGWVRAVPLHHPALLTGSSPACGISTSGPNPQMCVEQGLELCYNPFPGSGGRTRLSC